MLATMATIPAPAKQHIDTGGTCQTLGIETFCWVPERRMLTPVPLGAQRRLRCENLDRRDAHQLRCETHVSTARVETAFTSRHKALLADPLS